MPAGVLVTVPEPDFVTVSAWVMTANVAVTVRAWLIVTVHAPVPVHAPVQPVNVLPVAAVPVSVTDVPELYVAVHVAPQLMPAGVLVTVPVPAPDRVTVNANVTGANVAVTARA
jgi:hypothetical protein